MIDRLPLLAWPNQPVLTTLIFHRVLAAPDPLRPFEPDIDRFDLLMSFVARNLAVLELADAVDRLRRGALPRRACCITFDDGYSDNLTIALPILEKFCLPATVFVATGYLDGGRMFNDAVIDCISLTNEPRLDLRSLGLGVHVLNSNAAKSTAVAAILDVLKFSDPERRNQQVDGLLQVAACGGLPTDIMLTSDQLREMSRRGVEIGGHTVTHPVLTSVGNDRALSELAEGKRCLERIVGKPVSSFAYPNGRPTRDYGSQHVVMAKEVGFERAVTTAAGVAVRSTDAFQLPRFSPWNRSMFAWNASLARNAMLGGPTATC